jgi:hypothetical protein
VISKNEIIRAKPWFNKCWTSSTSQVTVKRKDGQLLIFLPVKVKMKRNVKVTRRKTADRRELDEISSDLCGCMFL